MRYTVHNRLTGETVRVDADSEETAYATFLAEHHTADVAAILSRGDFDVIEVGTYKGY